MTQITYCLYDLETGAILTTGLCDGSTLSLQPQNPGQGALQIAATVYPRDWYIDVTASPLAPAQRPAATATVDKTTFTADGSDGATLSNLPNPCALTLFVPGSLTSTKETVTSGSYKVTTTTAGLVRAYVEAFPQKLYQIGLTALPPAA